MMARRSYDAVAEKIFMNLEKAVKTDQSLNAFEIIPMLESDNRNSSPIAKGEETLGLESWIIPHIYPYAHDYILNRNNYKSQKLETLLPCLLGVALLNPEMPATWARRRELIISKKLQSDNELRLSRMALSRKPKCNEALAHRRWVILQFLKEVEDKSRYLPEELRLTEIIANRYHSNYHAWCHRMWSLQHLTPGFSQKQTPTNQKLINKTITRQEIGELFLSEPFSIFFTDFEKNWKWVSCHVSDHSGLNYRQFLLTNIIKMFTNRSSFEFVPSYNVLRQDPGVFFNSAKMNVLEFIKPLDFEDNLQKIASDYISTVNERVTLFEVLISLAVKELNKNYTMCLTYAGHEALWYYRRFLMFTFHNIIHSFSSDQSETDTNHQDKNGIPHKKDLKVGTEIIPDDFDNVLQLFKIRLLANEKDIVMSSFNSSDDHLQNLVNNYNHWCEKLFEN